MTSRRHSTVQHRSITDRQNREQGRRRGAGEDMSIQLLSEVAPEIDADAVSLAVGVRRFGQRHGVDALLCIDSKLADCLLARITYDF